MAYFEGEIPVVSGSNNGMFGGDGIWAILLLALLGGGFGYGRNNAPANEGVGWQMGKLATTNDVASGFATSEIMSDLNNIQLANAQGFAGLNTAINNATSTLGYNMLQGFHGVDNAICGLGRAIDGVNYNMAKNTCDIVTAINASNQRVIDYLTSDKIDTLNRKLAVAEGQISNYAQTNAIISALKPCPVPAYNVANPYCCNTGCTGIQ